MASVSLDDFLAKAARAPFDYGVDDCCLWLADWLVALGWPDPAWDLRGRYRTALGCARVLKREGGVVSVVGRCARRARIDPTKAPIRGDVGVVEAETDRGRHPVGALCLGRRWAMRAESGLLVAELTPIAAWRV